MDKKNSLIKSEKTIFNKIVCFFKSIFWKNKKEDLKIEEVNETENLLQEEIIREEKFEENILKTDEEILFDWNSDEEDFDIDLSSIPDYVYTDVEKFSFEKEKTRIFEIYEGIKNSTIKIEDVEIIDLIKINALLKEEEKIKYESLNRLLVKKSS